MPVLRPSRWAGLALRCVVLLASVVPARAQAGAWVIPAGRETQIQAFLAPLKLGEDTATGHRFDDLSIQRDHLVLTFLDAPRGPYVIELRHPDEAQAGERVGPLALRPAADVPAPLVALVRGILEGKSSDSLPWAAPVGSAPREAPPPRRGPSPATLIALAWLLIAGLVGTTGALLRQRWRASARPWGALGLLAGITLAGAAVRFALAPRTFLHEFYHVADYIQDDLFNISSAFLYGFAGPALHRLANALLGGDEQALFTANTVLASLTVPAVALLDLALFRRWPRALLAGGLFALLPVHVRFSASEELTIPAVLFGAWGLAAFVEWVQSRSRLALAAAVLAFALATNTRPEFVLLPVLAGASLLLLRPAEWRRVFAPELLVGLGALALLSVPRWFTMVAAEAGFAPDFKLAWGALPTLTTFLDPSITPRAYPVLAAAGCLWGAWRARGAHLWLVGCAAVFVLVSLAFFQNPPPYNWRTQLVAMPFLVVAAAGAWSLGAEWAHRPWLTGLLAAALLVPAVVGLRARTAAVQELADQQLEFAYLSENVATLPDEGQLLTVAQPGGRNLDAFPFFLLARTGKRFELLDIDAARKGRWPDAKETMIFYQGMYCWFAFADEPKPEPMAQRCLDVRRRYVLEPLNVQTISARPYSRLVYHPGPYELGFFRVTGLREPAPEPGAGAGP